MTGLALKSLWARRIRALTTTLAVVIGVAFVAGTYILTDTTFSAFDEIFADEPTGNLDSKASEDVLRLLRQAVDEFGQTVIMVTHDPAAAAHADRLITLRDGKVVHDAVPGSTDEVIELMKTID